MEKYTLSVLVENSAGVLSRVVGLFTRRGFNIHSLSVGTTSDDKISRITIEVKGDIYMVEQVSKQLSKLMEVIKIKTLRESELVKRGLVLVKIKTNTKNRGEIIEVANVFRANIIDMSPSTITAEVTGSDQKIQAFMNMVEPYGIEEMARTGMTALERGANTLKLDK
ncbi:MAG: acetolactate synthase small subunit [Clostridia bacterium]|nr:acetolactate synthase small subunit [Clostridia bacterium]